MQIKKCSKCEKQFVPKRTSNLFCSLNCSRKNRVLSYVVINCIVCGNKIAKRKNQSRADYAKAKYCSAECNYTKKTWNKGLTKEDPRVLSYISKNKTMFKKGDNVGQKNFQWKGNEASYNAKHMWIYRQYGKADKCIICGLIENIQWANISNNYTRDINDWVQLCIQHHRYFDLYKKDKIKFFRYQHVYEDVLKFKHDIISTCQRNK